MGRAPAESDVEEVVVPESDTESDEEDKLDSENIPDAQITDTSAAPPLQSDSQQIELLPLLSDPDAALPKNELIQRDFDAMEQELTQVASFSLI